MFCKNCGKQIGQEINFCPACGTRVAAETMAPDEQTSAYARTAGSDSQADDGKSRWASANQPPTRLVRPRSPRMIGGVCAAFALQYGWNLTVVRIVVAVFGLLYGVGILAYLICWIIIPEAQHALPSQSR